jgi:hypothetical protein
MVAVLVPAERAGAEVPDRVAASVVWRSSAERLEAWADEE